MLVIRDILKKISRRILGLCYFIPLLVRHIKIRIAGLLYKDNKNNNNSFSQYSELWAIYDHTRNIDGEKMCTDLRNILMIIYWHYMSNNARDILQEYYSKYKKYPYGYHDYDLWSIGHLLDRHSGFIKPLLKDLIIGKNNMRLELVVAYFDEKDKNLVNILFDIYVDDGRIKEIIASETYLSRSEGTYLCYGVKGKFVLEVEVREHLVMRRLIFSKMLMLCSKRGRPLLTKYYTQIL